jgi:hypothetical protein
VVLALALNLIEVLVYELLGLWVCWHFHISKTKKFSYKVVHLCFICLSFLHSLQGIGFTMAMRAYLITHDKSLVNAVSCAFLPTSECQVVGGMTL